MYSIYSSGNEIHVYTVGSDDGCRAFRVQTPPDVLKIFRVKIIAIDYRLSSTYEHT